MHKYMAGRQSLAATDDDLKLAALSKALCEPVAATRSNNRRFWAS
jgi:cytochrome o ubiquinol oxidase subunit 2